MGLRAMRTISFVLESIFSQRYQAALPSISLPSSYVLRLVRETSLQDKQHPQASLLNH